MLNATVCGLCSITEGKHDSAPNQTTMTVANATNALGFNHSETTRSLSDATDSDIALDAELPQSKEQIASISIDAGVASKAIAMASCSKLCFPLASSKSIYLQGV